MALGSPGYPAALCAIAIATAVSGEPAAALEPMPVQCAYDLNTGRTVGMEAMRSGLYPVYVSAVGTGFASWTVESSPEGRLPRANPLRAVLLHCPTGQTLTVLMPEGNAKYDVVDRYNRMVFGQGRFTMGALEQAMVQMGAQVRMTRGGAGACPCEVLEGKR